MEMLLSLWEGIRKQRISGILNLLYGHQNGGDLVLSEPVIPDMIKQVETIII